MNFSYWGSGPSDLAIAILADHLGEKPNQVKAYWKNGGKANYRGKGSRAIKHHQAFKEQYVGIWNREEGGQVTSDEIDRFLASKNPSQPRYQKRGRRIIGYLVRIERDQLLMGVSPKQDAYQNTLAAEGERVLGKENRDFSGVYYIKQPYLTEEQEKFIEKWMEAGNKPVLTQEIEEGQEVELDTSERGTRWFIK